LQLADFRDDFAISPTHPLMNQPELSSFIWSVADLLRGDYKQSEYGRVILPFTVLRRLDCVLEPTKDAVLKEKAAREKAGIPPEPFLLRKSGGPAISGNKSGSATVGWKSSAGTWSACGMTRNN
jgi:hypothetical protein